MTKLLFIYEHINNQDGCMEKSKQKIQTNNNENQEFAITNDLNSYQVSSSNSESEEEEYNTDNIEESKDDQFDDETDSSDIEFFNSIQVT